MEKREKKSNNNFKLSQLSEGQNDATWAIAVFAHNEVNTIELALDSVAATVKDKEIAVYVLANGCTDSTVEKVHNSASRINNLWLMETNIADKANAWNLFIHDLLSQEQFSKIEICFFMDGDVTLSSNALPQLASSLTETPKAEAAGAMPATGRNRDAWRQRMPATGMLAGNCYALRCSFVQRLREQQIRMPVGLIGEDFLVSWLVASNVWRNEPPKEEGIRCVFNSKAEFSFRSLSLFRPADYRTYLHRKWRYTLRGIQHQMLLLLLMTRGVKAMPSDVKELYRKAPLPSRLVWCGLDTPLRLFAVQWIRSHRKENKTKLNKHDQVAQKPSSNE